MSSERLSGRMTCVNDDLASWEPEPGTRGGTRHVHEVERAIRRTGLVAAIVLGLLPVGVVAVFVFAMSVIAQVDPS